MTSENPYEAPAITHIGRSIKLRTLLRWAAIPTSIAVYGVGNVLYKEDFPRIGLVFGVASGAVIANWNRPWLAAIACGNGGSIGAAADAIAWYIYPLPAGMARKFGDGIETIILATGIAAILGFVSGLAIAATLILVGAILRALARRW